jgi:hypothetical protein
MKNSIGKIAQNLAKEQKELLDKDQEFLKKHFPDLV